MVKHLFGRDDQVQAQNPTNRDFFFQWNSKRYKVGANKPALMPGFLAEQFVKELTDQMMQQEGRNAQLMNEDARKPYYERIIVNVSAVGNLEVGADSGEAQDLSEPDMPIKDSVARDAAAGSLRRKDKVEVLNDSAFDEELDMSTLPPELPELTPEEQARADERAKEAAETTTPVDGDPTEDEAFPDARPKAKNK